MPLYLTTLFFCAPVLRHEVRDPAYAERSEGACGSLAKGLQSHQAAEFAGVQAADAGGAIWPEISL